MQHMMARTDNRKLILCLLAAVCICVMSVQSIAADESKPGTHQGKGKLSLIEMAPALYKSAMRYPKFCGD